MDIRADTQNKDINFTPEFKAQVVLQLLREENTVVIGRWKAEFLERASEVFYFLLPLLCR